jgi:hypothetical protein
MNEIPHDRRGDMSKRHVSIVKTGSRPDYDAVLAAVRKSIDLIGGLDDVVKSGQMVLINPSWVAAQQHRCRSGHIRRSGQGQADVCR